MAASSNTPASPDVPPEVRQSLDQASLFEDFSDELDVNSVSFEPLEVSLPFPDDAGLPFLVNADQSLDDDDTIGAPLSGQLLDDSSLEDDDTIFPYPGNPLLLPKADPAQHHTFRELCADSVPFVRSSLASNPQIASYPDIVEILSQDKDASVREALLQNVAVSHMPVIQRLSASAQPPSVPPVVWADLSNDASIPSGTAISDAGDTTSQEPIIEDEPDMFTSGVASSVRDEPLSFDAEVAPTADDFLVDASSPTPTPTPTPTWGPTWSPSGTAISDAGDTTSQEPIIEDEPWLVLPAALPEPEVPGIDFAALDALVANAPTDLSIDHIGDHDSTPLSPNTNDPSFAGANFSIRGTIPDTNTALPSRYEAHIRVPSDAGASPASPASDASVAYVGAPDEDDYADEADESNDYNDDEYATDEQEDEDEYTYGYDDTEMPSRSAVRSNPRRSSSGRHLFRGLRGGGTRGGRRVSDDPVDTSLDDYISAEEEDDDITLDATGGGEWTSDVAHEQHIAALRSQEAESVLAGGVADEEADDEDEEGDEDEEDDDPYGYYDDDEPDEPTLSPIVTHINTLKAIRQSRKSIQQTAKESSRLSGIAHRAPGARRLLSRQSPTPPLPTSAPDAATASPTMKADSAPAKSRRTLIVAAASVIVVGGVAAVLVSRSGDTSSPSSSSSPTSAAPTPTQPTSPTPQAGGAGTGTLTVAQVCSSLGSTVPINTGPGVTPAQISSEFTQDLTILNSLHNSPAPINSLTASLYSDVSSERTLLSSVGFVVTHLSAAQMSSLSAIAQQATSTSSSIHAWSTSNCG